VETVEPVPRPTLLIFNPAAGARGDRRALAERVAAVLEGAGERVVLRPTEAPGHAARIVAEALPGGEVAEVLVLGGDGTLNEAITGAFRAGAMEDGAAAPRFGVVPAGTANVIARDLGLPRDALRAARRLAEPSTRRFDLGVCRSSTDERPFVLSAGVGIEAEVLAAVDADLKRRTGALAIAWAGLRACGASSRGLEVSLTLADGRRLEGLETASLAVGNSRFYAGAFRLSHRACTDDGLLEVALPRSTRLPSLVLLAAVARLSDAAEAPGARVFQARRVEVVAPRPIPVHVDAEPAGTTPAVFTVRRRALRLRVPG
jgi:YegS/Rv2252/BmrU family lipid kinase